MESTLRVYVYGGKLVKLLKEYQDMFMGYNEVEYNRCSFCFEVIALDENIVCPCEKERVIPCLIEFFEVASELMASEYDIERVKQFVSALKENEREIIDTVKKIKWHYEFTADLDEISDVENYLSFDAEKQEIMEEKGYVSADEVTDEDLLEKVSEFAHCLRYSEEYEYDSRRGIDNTMCSVDL